MRTARRWTLAALLTVVAGCGDQILGIPRSMPVDELEDADAMEVCDEFVALFCNGTPPPPYESFCNPCVLDELCALPALVSEMDAECDGVTVGQVRDCAGGRTEGLCAPASGGCMVEVGAALCPP